MLFEYKYIVTGEREIFNRDWEIRHVYIVSHAGAGDTDGGWNGRKICKKNSKIYKYSIEFDIYAKRAKKRWKKREKIIYLVLHFYGDLLDIFVILSPFYIVNIDFSPTYRVNLGYFPIRAIIGSLVGA